MGSGNNGKNRPEAEQREKRMTRSLNPAAQLTSTAQTIVSRDRRMPTTDYSTTRARDKAIAVSDMHRRI